MGKSITKFHGKRSLHLRAFIKALSYLEINTFSKKSITFVGVTGKFIHNLANTAEGIANTQVIATLLAYFKTSSVNYYMFVVIINFRS